MSKKKIGIVVAAVVMVAVVAWFAVGKINAMKEQAAMSDQEIQTMGIMRQDIKSTVVTSGTVAAATMRNVIPDISGKVDRVLVDEGQRVEKGQLLAVLDSSELEYQITQAELTLAIDKTNYEISYEDAKTQYEEAVQTYNEQKALYEADAISKSAYEDAKEAMDKAYNNFISDDNDNYLSQLEVKKQQVEASRLQLSKLNSDLEDTRILSPIDGMITNVNINPLDAVSQSTVMFIVQDTDNLEVVADVGEYDINKLEIGQDVVITGEAFAENEYQGVVSKIAPAAVKTGSGQSQETVVEVVVSILNPGNDIRPNFTADLEIVTGSREGALVVPFDAVIKRPDGVKILRMMEQGKPKMVEVTTGIESDLFVEIISDEVNEGDQVIVTSVSNKNGMNNGGFMMPGMNGQRPGMNGRPGGR